MSKPPQKPFKEVPDAVRVICDNCGTDLVADDRDSGKKATCPECGSDLTIPGAADRALRETLGAPPKKPPRKPAPSPRALDKAPVEIDAPPQGEGIPLDYSAVAHAQGVREKTFAKARPLSDKAEIARHEARAKLAGWLRRVAIVVLAFAVILVFECICGALAAYSPTSLDAVLMALGERIAAIPAGLRLLTVARPVEVGMLRPLEQLFLGMVMLVFAARLVVRTKLLDAIYVTTPRWGERRDGGLIFHFLALLLQAGLLAWAASVVKTPSASDGLACGMLALFLLVSAAWLVILYLTASDEYPDLASWAIADALFGVAIVLVVLWPGVTLLWSRAGATTVLCLANAAVALHLGASFIFARRPRGWWWRKPLFLVASVAMVLGAAVLLACVR